MSESSTEHVSLKDLPRKQRRVLGVLLEKAFTVPEQYPLTLKAATTGCNQKNNRDPVSNYDEDDVLETLNQLQERGLIGCLHTEGGRTERYRHYMRHKTPLNEQQLAIMTELMLRGKQQLGELRTRASRMVGIDSQEDLRRELQSLMDAGLVRANGPLDRRGIEVDHDLYPRSENHEPLATYSVDDSDAVTSRPASPPQQMSRPAVPEVLVSNASNERFTNLESMIRELRDELASVRSEFQTLQNSFEDLRRQLGG
ncbi:DUF480 domain-containing protein [Schlesneria paludicola]|uniref:DUF480 domain-containing protein n=1 Tax=Schlesneria paludicola TaxID=360056 RepID=UPI0012F88F08|nr:DUF480 domain-containing protein [Schlesneria paludicola]